MHAARPKAWGMNADHRPHAIVALDSPQRRRGAGFILCNLRL